MLFFTTTKPNRNYFHSTDEPQKVKQKSQNFEKLSQTKMQVSPSPCFPLLCGQSPHVDKHVVTGQQINAGGTAHWESWTPRTEMSYGFFQVLSPSWLLLVVFVTHLFFGENIGKRVVQWGQGSWLQTGAGYKFGRRTGPFPIFSGGQTRPKNACQRKDDSDLESGSSLSDQNCWEMKLAGEVHPASCHKEC